MLFWILVILQIVTGIVAGEAAIRKTPEGAATLQTLSKAGFFFLRWRAYADYKKELLGLQRLFGIAAIIFSVMFFGLGKTVAGTPFAILPGLFIFLWMAVQFGTNFRKSVREQLFMAAIMVIGPWGIYLLDYLTDFQFHQIRLLVRPLAPFGGSSTPGLAHHGNVKRHRSNWWAANGWLCNRSFLGFSTVLFVLDGCYFRPIKEGTAGIAENRVQPVSAVFLSCRASAHRPRKQRCNLAAMHNTSLNPPARKAAQAG
ncbi:MAG: hypothetical protein PHS32_16590 [Rhodoferax sp.]|uniref:hypothetical protein n=1 Tax=Rhodoferax sp. TaxID=50421 RepID=UPI002634BEE2|nr:hypothetical protein [Rhodoferax sp.]MDD5335352.1 hypothetical protein [Rhodoferax sp.]